MLQLEDAHWLHVAGPASIGGGPPSRGGDPPSPIVLHWAWHIWSVPNPRAEHGVLAMQFAMQSNCGPIIVEQLIPILPHVKTAHAET
jgi:hypothetical protein